jgi:hypothetical protein
VPRDRALDAGEAELERGLVGHRRGDEGARPVRVADRGEAIDRGAARVSEAEELRHLVKRLAGGVVARGAELADLLEPRALDSVERGVPAGDEQPDEGVARPHGRRIARTAQEHREQVADEVVDADERLACGPGEPLGGLHADEERPRESGAACDRDAVDRVERRASAGERLAHHRHDGARVISRGDLGDDAAVGGMERHLAVDDIGEDRPVDLDDGGRGLVARGLDA